jgi:hypothetical protein
MVIMAEHSTAHLAILIQQKHGCLLHLRDVGLRQRELIEQGDMSQLLRLLASKQQLIATLQRVEHELAPYRDEHPQTRLWPSPEDRARCAAQAAACRDLLDEIVRQERSNETLMTHRSKAVADRLQHVHAAARASGAYRAQTRMRSKIAEHSSAPTSAHDAPIGSARRASTMPSSLDLSSDIR